MLSKHVRYRASTVFMSRSARASLRLIAVLALVFAGPSARSAEPTALVVFGDSLSDSGGNPAPSPPYFEGRWSNGYTFADDLAPRFGQGNWLTPSSVADGTNYARGGARITGTRGVVEQIASYVHNSQWTVDKRAFHLVFIGGNDMRDGIVSALTTPSFNPAVFVDARLATLAVTLSGLKALGARHIGVMNLPDLSKLPGLPPPAAPLAAFMTARLNAGLARMVHRLDHGPGHVALIDVSAFFDGIMADAAAGGARFGITNVTGTCLTFVNGAPTAQCANPDRYLFWDQIHPTARVHALLADYVVDSLERRRFSDDRP